jgi:transcriptional regulator of acetoin/glycerol metabolism
VGFGSARATSSRRYRNTNLRLQAGRCVLEAVRTSNGNMSEAAQRLGISRNTLYRKLRELEQP